MSIQNRALLHTFLGDSIVGSPAAGNTALANYVVGTTTTASNKSGFLSNVPSGLSAQTVFENLSNSAAPASLGPGVFGFFDESYTLVTTAPTTCCGLYIAGASLYPKEELNRFMQGYKKANITHLIKPQDVKAFNLVLPCKPQKGVFHLGQVPAIFSSGAAAGAILNVEVTNVTCSGTATIPTSLTQIPVANLTIVSAPSGAAFGSLNLQVAQPNPNGPITVSVAPGSSSGFAVGSTFTGTLGTSPNQCTYTFQVVSVASATCCKDFKCATDYFLRIDLRGNPVYRNTFKNVSEIFVANAGCCVDATNIFIDPIIIYRQWAEKIASYPQTNPYIFPVLYYNGTWYYPPTSFYPNVTLPTGAVTWDTITPAAPKSSTFCSGTGAVTAGMVLLDIYQESVFDNASFLETDIYDYSPVIINAAEQIKPNTFDNSICGCGVQPKCDETTICGLYECAGHPGQGHGETALRRILDGEYYRLFGTTLKNICSIDDVRRREIEMITSIFSAVSRQPGIWYKYQIIYTWDGNGPSYAFTKTPAPYKVEIYTLGRITAFETFVTTWLSNCTSCSKLNIIPCNQCEIETNEVPTYPTVQ